jgi:hypothetical protein
MSRIEVLFAHLKRILKSGRASFGGSWHAARLGQVNVYWLVTLHCRDSALSYPLIAVRSGNPMRSGIRRVSETTEMANAKAELAAPFGNRPVSSRAIYEQHGNTTPWLPTELSDAVVCPQASDDVRQAVRIYARSHLAEHTVSSNELIEVVRAFKPRKWP